MNVLPSLVRSFVILGSLFFLVSCASYRTYRTSRTSVDTPPKVFQYSYKEPVRELVNPSLARKLSNGKVGGKLTIKLARGQSSTIRLGESYFSANGHHCRRYTQESAIAMSACKINNRWYQAQPILINQ